MSMLTDPLLRGAIDERMIAAMRLMLALLALLSTYIDPGETNATFRQTFALVTNAGPVEIYLPRGDVEAVSKER